MKFHLFCLVLLAAFPLNASGQESKPDQPSHVAVAVKLSNEYDSKVKALRREYYQKLAKMDAEYKAEVNDLRATLVKDLVELQSQTAKQNLDAAAQVLELARQIKKLPTLSPYEVDVAADRRVAVFLEVRPDSDIVERVHILAANGRSLVVNADYQTKVQSGEWRFDGDFITYTDKHARFRFDENPQEITVPIRYDANRKEYSYPDSVKKEINLESYANGSGHLMLGNPDFLIPSQPSGNAEEPSEQPKGE